MGAAAFRAVTTFTGDDHLFLAFARYVENPLIAFVRDQHGGEFYRPLPMLLWWLLGRLGHGSRTPFALLAFGLHGLVSVEVAALVAAMRAGPATDPQRRRGSNFDAGDDGGRGRHVALGAAGRDADGARQASALGARRAGLIAGALFFSAPMTEEAAFWYSASTDLLATAFGLGAVIAVLRGRTWISALLFAGACWSKETALVVPLLGVVALASQAGSPAAGREGVRRCLALVPVAVTYVILRTIVLGGLGRSGDEVASLPGKLLQIVSGLIHLAGTGQVVANEGLAWALGMASWVLLLLGGVRVWRGSSARSSVGVPLLWVLITVLPLLAAPWAVGARYFYFPAVGLAWLAEIVLTNGPRSVPVVVVAVLAALLGLDFAQGIDRRAEVLSYQARLSAARRAVADGLDHGFRTFHVAAGIKDLDLAVKEGPRFAAHEADLLVLGDSPASFVAVPETRAAALDFLLARPPLPPSGAYRFGDRRIVGLARRGDDPTLDEVITRLPGIRFIRLRLGPAGHIIARDVTDGLRTSDPGQI